MLLTLAHSIGAKQQVLVLHNRSRFTNQEIQSDSRGPDSKYRIGKNSMITRRPSYLNESNQSAQNYFLLDGILYIQIRFQSGFGEAQLVVPEFGRQRVLNMLLLQQILEPRRYISKQQRIIIGHHYVEDFAKNCTDFSRFKPANLKPIEL